MKTRQNEPFTADPSTGEIVISGIIGAMIPGGIDVDAALPRISAMKGSADVVKLVINSPGGDANDGIALYHALRELDMPIEAHIIGKAWSAATLPLMAAAVRRINKGANVMIHEPRSRSAGSETHTEAMSRAKATETLASDMADIYAAHTAMDRDQALEAMRVTTWMGSRQAIDKGFATEEMGSPAIAAYCDPAYLATIDVPDEYAAMVKWESEVKGTPNLDYSRVSLKLARARA